jgi:hypothetical protein
MAACGKPPSECLEVASEAAGLVPRQYDAASAVEVDIGRLAETYPIVNHQAVAPDLTNTYPIVKHSQGCTCRDDCGSAGRLVRPANVAATRVPYFAPVRNIEHLRDVPEALGGRPVSGFVDNRGVEWVSERHQLPSSCVRRGNSEADDDDDDLDSADDERMVLSIGLTAYRSDRTIAEMLSHASRGRLRPQTPEPGGSREFGLPASFRCRPRRGVAYASLGSGVVSVPGLQAGNSPNLELVPRATASLYCPGSECTSTDAATDAVVATGCYDIPPWKWVCRFWGVNAYNQGVFASGFLIRGYAGGGALAMATRHDVFDRYEPFDAIRVGMLNPAWPRLPITPYRVPVLPLTRCWRRSGGSSANDWCVLADPLSEIPTSYGGFELAQLSRSTLQNMPVNIAGYPEAGQMHCMSGGEITDVTLRRIHHNYPIPLQLLATDSTDGLPSWNGGPIYRRTSSNVSGIIRQIYQVVGMQTSGNWGIRITNRILDFVDCVRAGELALSGPELSAATIEQRPLCGADACYYEGVF